MGEGSTEKYFRAAGKSKPMTSKNNTSVIPSYTGGIEWKLHCRAYSTSMTFCEEGPS